MLRIKATHSVLILLLAGAGFVHAQEANPTATQVQPDTTSQMQQQDASQPGAPDSVALYKIEVVARDIPAINYFHRSGSTRIGFQGTSLLPGAGGSAKVSAQAGRTVIDAELDHLTPANSFGAEYLTYVLWAITPEGRPVNLGEVLPSGSKDKMQITVTTNLQAFGLIVTAEPYFAVTMPSDLVVLQNVVLGDKTQGEIGVINAHYSLLPRGAYAETAGRHAVLHPITRDERSPLELYEALNAVQIAEAAGAAQYASDTLATAKTSLQNAEGFDKDKHDRKQTITYAREAVQSAEDARIITIRKIKAADEAAQQQARIQAEQSAQQAHLAEQQAQENAEQQTQQRAQADAARAQAEAAAAAAQAQAAQAQQAQQAAEQQVEQARERLKDQLNQVLQTTETARGLIVNMSDVLFDTNKFTLKPDAREKLAKVSGILAAYPNLKLQVEGYTDNTGSDDYNQKLSEERADSVQTYLISQGVQQQSVTATGYGKNDPIADNSTSAGRAQNRRVQLVVSGNSIGIQAASPGAASEQNPPPPPPAQPTPAPNPTGTANPPGPQQ